MKKLFVMKKDPKETNTYYMNKLRRLGYEFKELITSFAVGRLEISDV